MTSVYAAVMAVVMAGAPEQTQLHEFGDLIVGEWGGDASLIEHAPGDGEKREKAAAKLTYRWILDGSAVEGEWRRGDVSGKWMLVWDPAANVIRQAGGRSDGNIWEGLIVKKGDEWIGETKGILGDGTEVTSRFITVFQNSGNKLVWEGEFSIDGEKQEPVRDVYEKLKGKSPLQESGELVGGPLKDEAPTAEDYYEFAEYWIGDWKATYKTSDERMAGLLGGEVVEAEFSIRWSPTKRCQEVKISVGGVVKRHALWGFDPEMKRWRGVAFNADGSWGLGIHGPEVLKAKFGKPFKTEVKGAKPDGSPVIGEWSTTLIDEETYKLDLFERQSGKRKLVLSIECERKK